MEFLILFALGSFWFWVLTILSFVAITCTVEYEHSVWAFIVFLITLLLYDVANKGGVFNWIGHNPLPLFLYFLAYIIIGIMWVFPKWYFFLLREKDEYKEMGGRALSKDSNYFKDLYPPKVAKHKKEILRWMTWWPFSMAWTLLNDPLRKMFEFMYRRIASTLQAMSNKMFVGLIPEDKKEEPKK